MRTKDEISISIKNAFIQNTSLRSLYGLGDSQTDFDTVFSSVSLESILISIISLILYYHEFLWNTFKTEVEETMSSGIVLSIRWYYEKALDFQLGYELIFNSSSYAYAYEAIDDSAKIIKYVAVREYTDATDHITKLKILFSGVNKVAITGDNLTAFENYMNKIGAAGTHYVFVSQNPNDIRVRMNIYYDPQVINSSGQLISDASNFPVQTAIKNYIDTIEYGGIFYATKLVDAVQAVDGVNDVELLGEMYDEEESFSIRRTIESTSGAFNITFDSLNSIDDLTYIVGD